MKSKHGCGTGFSIAVSILSIVLITAVLTATGCQNNDRSVIPVVSGDPSWSIVSFSSCKVFAGITAAGRAGGRDCFAYSYDGDSTLSITHINAALNCAPGTITADIEFSENSITIGEREGDDAQWAHCLCLYDIEFEFTGVEPGACMIAFDEKYDDSGVILEALVLLEPGLSDTICVERTAYPWAMGEEGGDPYGELSGDSGCKARTSFLEKETDPSGSSCISYVYDGNGLLFFDHVNAGFNCCQDMVYASISIDDGTITVSEGEDPEGGLCDCLCLFDLHFIVRNLEPGTWTIKFLEPYVGEGDEAIEFTVDLLIAPSGEHCVTRTRYPWGL